jgi:hypothetical protein
MKSRLDGLPQATRKGMALLYTMALQPYKRLVYGRAIPLRVAWNGTIPRYFL